MFVAWFMQISEQLQSIYGDDIVIELVTYAPDAVNKPRTRRGRSLLEGAGSSSSVVSSAGGSKASEDLVSSPVRPYCIQFVHSSNLL